MEDYLSPTVIDEDAEADVKLREPENQYFDNKSYQFSGPESVQREPEQEWHTDELPEFDNSHNDRPDMATDTIDSESTRWSSAPATALMPKP